MYVYILYSETRSRYYTGQTVNIDNRLKRHNSGGVKSTRFGIPWRIIWHLEVASRSEAMSLERRIKKRGVKRFLESRGVA